MDFKPEPIEYEVALADGLAWCVQPGFIYQEKIDGKRALLVAGELRGRVQRYNCPAPCPEWLMACVLDGELVGITYHAFDVLQWRGDDVRGLPLKERLNILNIISAAFPLWIVPVKQSANGGEFLEAILRDGGEGIVRKPLNRTYHNGEWMKCKRLQTFDLIVESLDAKKRSAACYQWKDGQRLDVGRVNLGMEFDSVAAGSVIEVAAMSRHASGKLREARFVRLRTDKPAAQCRA